MKLRVGTLLGGLALTAFSTFALAGVNPNVCCLVCIKNTNLDTMAASVVNACTDKSVKGYKPNVTFLAGTSLNGTGDMPYKSVNCIWVASGGAFNVYNPSNTRLNNDYSLPALASGVTSTFNSKTSNPNCSVMYHFSINGIATPRLQETLNPVGLQGSGAAQPH